MTNRPDDESGHDFLSVPKGPRGTEPELTWFEPQMTPASEWARRRARRATLGRMMVPVVALVALIGVGIYLWVSGGSGGGLSNTDITSIRRTADGMAASISTNNVGRYSQFSCASEAESWRKIVLVYQSEGLAVRSFTIAVTNISGTSSRATASVTQTVVTSKGTEVVSTSVWTFLKAAGRWQLCGSGVSAAAGVSTTLGP